ncbi:MAG TPA: cyclic nucleotide-binding protein, partial [Alcanivorax sp.]|nr:cyclic nucleotide-binding protein [Alcanivorax sp.]
DLFGALSVLNGRSRYRFITEEETLCYLIPADLFQSLCQDQKEFDDYFRQRLASKNQLLAERREGGVTM